MKVNVFATKTGWCADPPQLGGSPPNGFGKTPREAVDNLVARLGRIRPDGCDAGFLPTMKRFGWPMLEVKFVGAKPPGEDAHASHVGY